MKSNQINLFQIYCVTIAFTSYLYAGKLFRKKNIFEKCLNIISVSADKLSTYPKISDDLIEKSGNFCFV